MMIDEFRISTEEFSIPELDLIKSPIDHAINLTNTQPFVQSVSAQMSNITNCGQIIPSTLENLQIDRISNQTLTLAIPTIAAIQRLIFLFSARYRKKEKQNPDDNLSLS